MFPMLYVTGNFIRVKKHIFAYFQQCHTQTVSVGQCYHSFFLYTSLALVLFSTDPIA